MKFLIALTLLLGPLLSPAAHADQFGIQPGGQGLNLYFSGFPKGATEELLSFMVKGGLPPEGSVGSTSYASPGGEIWGWQSTVPELMYSFFIALKPGEEKDLNVTVRIDPPDSNGLNGPNVTVEIPDAASAVIYDLMGKAGIKEDPQDKSRARVGQNIYCWGYHGYPQGDLSPKCRVTLQLPNAP